MIKLLRIRRQAATNRHKRRRQRPIKLLRIRRQAATPTLLESQPRSIKLLRIRRQAATNFVLNLILEVIEFFGTCRPAMDCGADGLPHVGDVHPPYLSGVAEFPGLVFWVREEKWRRGKQQRTEWQLNMTLG